jgi:hypothetical protein
VQHNTKTMPSLFDSLDQQTMNAIVTSFHSADFFQIVVQNFLDLTKEIEDIGFLLKMGLVSKSFQIAVWKNPTVLRLFYTAYSQRTNLQNPQQYHSSTYPNFFLKICTNFPPVNWEIQGALSETDEKRFQKTVHKIMALAYTPYCTECHCFLMEGHTQSDPFWDKYARYCRYCCHSKFISDRRMKIELDVSTMDSFDGGSTTKVMTSFQNEGVTYLALHAYKENATLLKFTSDPVDFVADYRKNSTVYLFWRSDIENLLSMDKIKLLRKQKYENMITLAAYFRASIYRRIITSAFEDKRLCLTKPQQIVTVLEEMDPSEIVMEVEVEKERDPVVDIQWITLNHFQRTSVHQKIMKMFHFLKLRPDPVTPFIEDPMRKRKFIRYQKNALARSKTYLDWDAENITSRRKLNK